MQAKKLAKMDEADFAFDENEWLAPNDQPREEEDVVTEVLKEVEVTEDMGPEERYKLLQARYPEFDYLVDEFREAQTLLPVLQKEAEGKPNKSLEVTKSWLVGCYVAALASYFAILTSPSRDTDGSVATLNPSELRDHEVMETLMECREAWLRAKDLKLTKPSTAETGMLSPPDEDDLAMPDVEPIPKRKSDKLSKSELKVKKTKAAEAARKAKVVEQSLADLSTLLKSTKKSAKAAATPITSADAINDDNKSDFGEEDALDARTAADKARRKKTLKFYTSQIVQKANKRAGAGRDAGGDMDIPYRERFVSYHCRRKRLHPQEPPTDFFYRGIARPASTPRLSAVARRTVNTVRTWATTRATATMPLWLSKSVGKRTSTTTWWRMERKESGRTRRRDKKPSPKRARMGGWWSRHRSGRTGSARSRTRSRRTRA